MTKESKAFLRLLIELGMVITAFVIAGKDGNDECQDLDADVTLKVWLLVYGVNSLVVSILTVGAIMINEDGHKNTASCIGFFAILCAVFQFAWLMTGAVVLAEDHSDCVNGGHEIGVITVVILGWTALSIFFKLFGSDD